MLYGISDISFNYNMIEHAINFIIKKEMLDEPYNCYLSPLYTPDFILKEYPKITFGLCGLDLTCDAGFIFASRVLSNIKNKEDVSIKFFTDMVHGALDNKDKGFASASVYYDKTVEVIKKFLNE